MARKKLQVSLTLPYHVTNRCNNKEWFSIPIDRVWRIFCWILTNSAQNYGVEIHTFVLMSNHYHMIVSTPLGNLDAFMRYFQTEVCRHIQRASGRINHVFGTRYRWTLLEDSEALACAYKYVVRNPVRAGMAKRVQDYPCSAFTSLLNMKNEFPQTERRDVIGAQIPKNLEERIRWLNRPTPKELESLVGKALRRYNFKFSRGNDVRLKLEQLRDSYGIEQVPATFSAEK
jgi:putative transposase